ncbi:MAG: ribonuclease HI family protein [Armatimonadota bacterium]
MTEASTTATTSATLYTDGASKGNPGPAGAGFVLTDSNGEVIVCRAIPLGVTTVGVAEYRALIGGMAEAASLGIKRLCVFTDSQFMARQMQGIYKVRTPVIRPLYDWATKLRARFERFEITHVTRDHNEMADKLACEGARRSACGEKEEL